jgi:hypothetical protein
VILRAARLPISLQKSLYGQGIFLEGVTCRRTYWQLNANQLSSGNQELGGKKPPGCGICFTPTKSLH